jgi:c-di-GMP-binding flagellar brake protein YcgR
MTGNADGLHRREFVRVTVALPVRYKFLPREGEPENILFSTVYQGNTANISGGGILLTGVVPRKEWIAELLTHKITLGLNIFIENALAREEKIKALAQVAWMESFEKKENCSLGLMFTKISAEDREKILEITIRSQMS